MVFKNLLRRKARTLLTLTGIAIGVAAIVAMRAMADGLISGYTQVFAEGRSHLVLCQARGDSAGSISLGAIDEHIGGELAAMPNVKSVAGMVFSFASMKGIPYFFLFGYDPNQFAIQHFEIVEGVALGAAASPHQEQQVLIGRRAAGNLGKKVGDVLPIHKVDFYIVGIYETGVAIEDGGAVLSLSDAQRITNQPQQVTAYLIQVEDTDELAATRQQIAQRFPKLSASLGSEVVDKVEGFKTISAFAWGISITAMLVGGVGMMNTVVMSVLERTKEIGAWRALGWRKSRVFALVLGEAALLSLLGGLAGGGLGVLLVKGISRLPAVGSLGSGDLTLNLFVQALVVALGLGIVGGLLPAWWASRLVPLEALRYEELASTKSNGRLGRCALGGMVLRNLWRSQARSLFTVAGAAIGVLAVVTIGAFSEGLTATFAALAKGSDLMVMQADVSDMEFSAIPQDLAAQLAALPGVAHVSGGISGPIALAETPIFSLTGFDPAGYAVQRFKVVTGSALSAEQEILLGKRAAESLEKKVGGTLDVLDRTYRVVGIYETGDPIEEFAGVVTLREAQVIFGKPQQVSFFAIKAQAPDDVEGIQRTIAREFPDLLVTRSAEFASSLLEIKLLQGGVTGVSILAVLVGAVGLTNTMIMSVFERTRQIGLLRAVGWRRSRVLGMVLGESFILTLSGGLLGIVLAGAMIKAFELSPETASISVQLTPLLAVQAFGLAAALGVLGGLYPAWWASRLMPVEALKYE